MLNSQYIVSLLSNKGTDTLKVCKGNDIEFYAYGINGVDTLEDMMFFWDFGDGNFIPSKPNNDTVTYKFVSPQLYRVTVRVHNSSFDDYHTLPVLVGLPPFFTGTTTDIPESQQGICSGETISLIGKINTNEYKEKRQKLRKEIFPQYIDSEHNYTSYITRRSFAHNAQITSAENIDSIGILMESSNTANIQIKLSCPSGKTVILKDYGGVEKNFGEPVIAPGDLSEGTPYWYYFTNTPEFGTMNTYSGSDTLPSGSYQAQNPLTDLIGCPLNGNWTITVSDNTDDSHDSYLFAWLISFNKSVETELFSYTNTYNFPKSVWNGANINYTTNGIGEATPKEKGTNLYHFLIKDNYGCYHDTNIAVFVESPTIKVEKEAIEIGDSSKISDETSWATQWEWDFGDDSDIFYKKEKFKKYLDSGTYSIILTAYSKTGCKDYDTAKIKVTPRSPLKITDYNIFTPNNDGVNDIFTFFTTPDELITAANIKKVKARIYNRWGEVICKWNTAEEIVEGWNGTVNNKGKRDVPEGFYYYVISFEGKDGVDYKSSSGFIYLYRP